MGLLPPSRIEKVQFFEAHVSGWASAATSIGTTTTAITDLTTKTTAARAAFLAQQTAKDAAEAATLNYNAAVQTMVDAGMDVVRQIKTKAGIVGGDSIYVLANIPAPGTPSPVGPPGLCNMIKATFDGIGGLLLTWKASNPPGASGTLYQVYRKIDDGALTYVGGSGRKDYVDNTIPMGTSMITYKIQGVRSTAPGPWATFVVELGTVGSGMTIKSAKDITKIAA